MKKITALLLSLAMMFSMATFAIAEEDVAEPETAEEISADLSDFGGFEEPEIFDESVNNPGVEIDGDAEQDEATPDADEEDPSEAESEEPAEEPTETEEPTEAETEPEVEPDNAVSEEEAAVSEEEVEAFKEYVYSLGDTPLEEGNVTELFLALQIIDENSEMTYEEYYQAVIDAGIDKMSDLVEKAIEWKILDLRQNDPDWIVQSDTGIEGPEFEGMAKFSEAEEIALWQLLALWNPPRKLTITFNPDNSGIAAGDTVTLNVSGGVPFTTDGGDIKNNNSESVDVSVPYAKLEAVTGEEELPSDITIELSGKNAALYNIKKSSYANGKVAGLRTDRQVTISGMDFYTILAENSMETIYITVEKKTIPVTMEEQGTPSDTTLLAEYEITGLKGNSVTKTGSLRQINSGIEAFAANAGDHIRIRVTQNPNMVKSIQITGKKTTGQGTTTAAYDVADDDENITITVTYKTHAVCNDVKVKLGEEDDQWSTVVSAITVSGTAASGESINDSCSAAEAFKNTIAKFYDGDSVTLTVSTKDLSNGMYRLESVDGGGNLVKESNTVNGLSLSATGMTLTFTFKAVKNAPTLLVSVAPTSKGGTVTFTIQDYAETYKGDDSLEESVTVTVNLKSTTNRDNPPDTTKKYTEKTLNAENGTFGVHFEPKNQNGFNFDYTFDVTGEITYDDKTYSATDTIALPKVS